MLSSLLIFVFSVTTEEEHDDNGEKVEGGDSEAAEVIH